MFTCQWNEKSALSLSFHGLINLVSKESRGLQENKKRHLLTKAQMVKL